MHVELLNDTTGQSFYLTGKLDNLVLTKYTEDNLPFLFELDEHMSVNDLFNLIRVEVDRIIEKNAAPGKWLVRLFKKQVTVKSILQPYKILGCWVVGDINYLYSKRLPTQFHATAYHD